MCSRLPAILNNDVKLKKMRKFYYLFLSTFLFIGVFSSCSKESKNEQNDQDYSISNIMSNFNEKHATFKDFKSIEIFVD